MQKEFLETFFTPTQQLMLFFYSILLGAAISLLYDAFRVIRTLVPHTWILVAIEDILFCLIWAISVFVFSMELSRGEVRAYFFLGNILGFILCHFTVGNVAVGVIRRISDIIKSIFKWLYKIFIIPIINLLVLISQKLKSVFVCIYSKYKKSSSKNKIRLKDKHKMMYNERTHIKNIRRCKRNGVFKKHKKKKAYFL